MHRRSWKASPRACSPGAIRARVSSPIADPTLSRRHAEIFVENGQLFIRDLGSANGTWVDGVHLGARAVCRSRAQSQVWLGHIAARRAAGTSTAAATVMAHDVPAELKALIAARQQQHQRWRPRRRRRRCRSAPAVRRRRCRRSSRIASKARTRTACCCSRSSRTRSGTAARSTASSSSRRGQPDGRVDHRRARRVPQEGRLEAVTCGTASSCARARGARRTATCCRCRSSCACPPGTAMSSRDVSWEIRGDVDINWASDIHASIPITMRNQDIERIRDALGAMDYRVVDIETAALGQHFEGTFAPPAQPREADGRQRDPDHDRVPRRRTSRSACCSTARACTTTARSIRCSS